MFAYISGYSGQSIYDDYYITCYNMAFTAFPLLAKAIYDQDVNPHVSQDGPRFKSLLPKLYYVGQKSTIFNWTNYFIWVFTGMIHSLIIFIIPYFVYNNTILTNVGKNGDMWIFSITSFTCIIFVRRFLALYIYRS
jgi:magnesium-transporting ATPase (P-type)